MNMELPNWLAIVQAENRIFVDKRAGIPPEDRWTAYANAAQVVLGFTQDLEEAELEGMFDLKSATPVIAAARILDSTAAVHLRSWRETGSPEASEMALSSAALAAFAYGILGNFPSACAVLEPLAEKIKTEQPYIATLLACAAPRLLGTFYPASSDLSDLSGFLDSLEFFLKNGSEAAETILHGKHSELRERAGDVFESSVWLTSRVALAQVIRLGTVKTLRGILPDGFGYFDKLTSSGIKTLLPSQYFALTKTTIAHSTGNAVVSLPTSTGKTLLSEIALCAGIRPGKIGVLVVPYVALGRQIAQSVEKHLPAGWRLHRLFGGYSDSVELDLAAERNFLVATPERFDLLLRSQPELIDEVDCVVFDEAHIVESGERGARVEGLITRILLRQAGGVPIRIILVSAVIPNAEDLKRWTGATAGNVVVCPWHGASRRLALWQGGELIWFHSNDPLTPEGISGSKPLARVALPWPNNFIPRSGDFAETKFFQPKDTENLAFLLGYLWERYREPVLCVCSTKDMTRRVASAARARVTPNDEHGKETARAIAMITDRYRQCLHLKLALESGIAYHNASLPHDLRAAIEDAAANKELRIVVSTTTLAEGVDLPFRVTVLADWLGWKNDKQAPLAPLLVRNIAGRCGRAGSFTEGDVVIYDSPLGDSAYKSPSVKGTFLRKVLFSEGDEGITSSVESDFESEAVRGAIASQLLAAVVENPENENLDQDFYDHMLGAQKDQASRINHLLKAIGKEITSGDWQLAVRNSPFAITGLGEAVNQSGFSPRSSKSLAGALRSIPNDATGLDIVVFLLENVGDLPEQQNAKFRKLVQHAKQIGKTPNASKAKGRPKLPIKMEDIRLIVSQWIEGAQPIDIFKTLPSLAKSSRKPPLTAWLAGLSEPSTWDDEFDKFCEFLNSVLFEFTPWMLRACSLLSAYLDQKPAFDGWADLAAKFRRESAITTPI